MGLNAIFRDLAAAFPNIVQQNVPLNEVSRWRIGGTADIVVSPRNIQELAQLRKWIFERNLPNIVFGATSNLLFDDHGLQAIAIHIGSNFATLDMQDQYITAGPGVWVPGLARTAMLAGLTGIEHTCGIPGTLGGLVCMNGGSQRKGIGTHVQLIRSVDEQGNIKEYTPVECQFSYRHSIFQNNNEVIAGIVLKLEPSTTSVAEQRLEMLKILRDRRHKFPLKLPNCGSVFVSNPAMYENYGPPGKVIEQVGLKGTRIGDAEICELHANFIVNNGNAKANDVLALINLARETVYKKTGYLMAVEAKFVATDGLIKNI